MLFALILLLYFVKEPVNGQCCDKKFTYSEDGHITELYLLKLEDSRALMEINGAFKESCIFLK